MLIDFLTDKNEAHLEADKGCRRWRCAQNSMPKCVIKVKMGTRYVQERFQSDWVWRKIKQIFDDGNDPLMDFLIPFSL